MPYKVEDIAGAHIRPVVQFCEIPLRVSEWFAEDFVLQHQRETVTFPRVIESGFTKLSFFPV